MLLRNSNLNIRNMRLRFQSIDYQCFLETKERWGQNKEHSTLIKLHA